MEVLFYILCFLILLLILILILPISVIVNTEKNIYMIDIFRILRVGIDIDLSKDDPVLIKIKTPIYSFEIPVLEKILNKKRKNKVLKNSNEKTEKIKKKTKNANKKNISFNAIKTLIIEIFVSFKVNYLYLNIDTRNYPVNGMLIPIFANIQGKNKNLNVNFDEIFYINGQISNRAINVIFPIIKFLLNNKRRTK